mgnify:CR=1 FL=1
MTRKLFGTDGVRGDANSADDPMPYEIREADRVLTVPSKGFGALIEVNRSIRDGLT